MRVDDGVVIPEPEHGELWVVGAVIANEDGCVFAQRRSPDRRLFPNAWDIVGGHVEPGETLVDALVREVHEETGWQLARVRSRLAMTRWFGDDGEGERREADFLVEVDGDLRSPTLEWPKHVAYAWFGPEDLGRLKENRPVEDTMIHDLISTALLENRSS